MHTKNNDLLFEALKGSVNSYNTGSNYGKLHLIKELLLDIDTINVDSASRVKIRLWLENHYNKINKND